MREIFVVSDTHFNHTNIIKYCDRPFQDALQMNEVMIENWNSVVKPGDLVYHLGDVYMSKGQDIVSIMARLNGSKRLILGNHDNGKDQILLNAFQKILAWRHFKEFGLLLTHVPVHPSTLNEKVPVNVHGHIHQNLVRNSLWGGIGLVKVGEETLPSSSDNYDQRYKNVCVEHTNYTPVHIEILRVKT